VSPLLYIDYIINAYIYIYNLLVKYYFAHVSYLIIFHSTLFITIYEYVNLLYTSRNGFYYSRESMVPFFLTALLFHYSQLYLSSQVFDRFVFNSKTGVLCLILIYTRARFIIFYSLEYAYSLRLNKSEHQNRLRRCIFTEQRWEHSFLK
jgi:hypothetical protein